MWVFERSSGYAGFRCDTCGAWVYETQEIKCSCVSELKHNTSMIIAQLDKLFFKLDADKHTPSYIEQANSATRGAIESNIRAAVAVDLDRALQLLDVELCEYLLRRNLILSDFSYSFKWQTTSDGGMFWLPLTISHSNIRQL